MYHGAGYRKLGKKSDHRMAMFANACNSLIEHERIQTTLPKAKDLRRVIERLITKGKGGTLHDRRNVFSFLRQDEPVKKLFENIAPRFKDRQGGYTRILKLAETRRGDAADVAIIEFVDYVRPTETSKEDKKKARSEAKAKAKEEAKAKAASRPAKAPKAPKAGKTTGKAGANSSVGRSGSRGT
jgi:large subunit ribosomal protein L17